MVTEHNYMLKQIMSELLNINLLHWKVCMLLLYLNLLENQRIILQKDLLKKFYHSFYSIKIKQDEKII